MFTATSKIQYKNSWWVVAEVPEGITEYYRNWVKTRYGIQLMGSRWTPHITIVRGEEPVNKELWMKYHDAEWEFTYDNNVRRDNDTVFWWVNVQCEKMLDLREGLGLARLPKHDFHITVGREHPTDYFTKINWIK